MEIMSMHRFECHSHTMYSNLRLLDCINTPRGLIDRAYELGLAGIAITDHECLSSHVEIDKIVKEYKEINPDFKIARGNEIYLVDERCSNQQYYHFILIAKDSIGHRMLRELSSNSWLNSYFDRGMERVPTTKAELIDKILEYGKGHLIASSACLGGELASNIIKLEESRKIRNKVEEQESYDNIMNFVSFCKNLFEDDFYFEVQPAKTEEQIVVNNMIAKLSDVFDIKIIVTTDAHYLSPKDRKVHEAFLNSKGGERETDDFYRYAYLQTTEEVIENLSDIVLDYYELEKNTIEIYNKIEDYTIAHTPIVPQVEVCEYDKCCVSNLDEKYKTLNELLKSDNNQERYWVNRCLEKLDEIGFYNDEYLSRLEEEARTKSVIGEKINSCMFAYPIFLQKYIDLIWECGSPIGVGRGSAGAGLNHYLLGITQCDPIKHNLPWFRYMNDEREEMPKTSLLGI